MSATDTSTLPDYAPVPRSAIGPALNEQGYYVGRVERIVALLQGFIGGLPDLNTVEQDAFAQGDLVAMRFVVNASHSGPLFGVPATGNHAPWIAVDVYGMENGKIAEEWAADDLTAILHDMGLYTPPWLS